MMRERKPKTETVVVPDDILEAQSMRAKATRDQQDAENQGPAIARLTSYLLERRTLNHFGESIQITFTRRGHA